jgi:flavodoxin
MKIIIKESQLQKILSEQDIMGALSDPSNLNFDPGMNTDYSNSSNCKKENPPKNMLIALFTYCNKVQPDSNTAQIKKWNDRLYNAMKGMGTNPDFIKVLNEIQTINQLAAIWKTFKYENENLWQWMQGETRYDWSDTWKAINNKVKSPAKIPECLEYDKSKLS